MCIKPRSSDDEQTYKLSCKLKSHKIYISQVLYENDFDNYCSDSHYIDTSQNEELRQCRAFNNDLIRSMCNSKQECHISLNDISKANLKFKIGIDGSNCNFTAERLTVRYECINGKDISDLYLCNFETNLSDILFILKDNLKDESVFKYNICNQDMLNYYPNEAFITSPNYPSAYSRRSYCQLKIKLNPFRHERLELYLIDLHMEKASLLTANPTDYLELNGLNKYFGDRGYELLINTTSDISLTFKTDNFFNKRGFLVYFRGR